MWAFALLKPQDFKLCCRLVLRYHLDVSYRPIIITARK
jgi:hypothetical protein